MLKRTDTPILPISNSIAKSTDNDIKYILFVYNLMKSGNWSYGYKRGKYGIITDYNRNKTYRISQIAFERMKKIIDEL